MGDSKKERMLKMGEVRCSRREDEIEDECWQEMFWG
jgi:hypothetical protein